MKRVPEPTSSVTFVLIACDTAILNNEPNWSKPCFYGKNIDCNKIDLTASLVCRREKRILARFHES
jgi:hypothetical protein